MWSTEAGLSGDIPFAMQFSAFPTLPIEAETDMRSVEHACDAGGGMAVIPPLATPKCPGLWRVYLALPGIPIRLHGFERVACP